MPLLDIDKSVRGRMRLFIRTQLPFVLGLAYFVAVVATVDPDSLSTPVFLTGTGVAVLATLLALVVPWERLPKSSAIAIAALDIAAVALMQAEIFSVILGVTLLAIYPILWATYLAGWQGIVLAALGSVFIVVVRIVFTNGQTYAAGERASALTVPVAMVGLAVMAFVGARELRRHTRDLAQALDAESAALGETRDAERMMRGVLDTVGAGVAFYDSDGRMVVANARAHDLARQAGFGLSAPPYSGDHVLDSDRTTPVPSHEQLIPSALRGDTVQDNLTWVGPPEAQVAVMSSSARVRRGDGSVQGTVVVAYDVTELAEAIEVREEFLRTVGHELRTPLAGVTGFLALIEDRVDPDDAKLHGYLEVVTRRTADLLDRVAELTAPMSSSAPVERADVDMGEVIDAARRRAAALLDAETVLAQILVTGRSRVRGDAARLESVVAELMTNALKFGTPGTSIAVTCEQRDDRVFVAVSNEGPALSHAEQRRVFDRFFRAPYARTHAIQGFGLGLTNVRATMEAHGGGVRIDSAPGGRTTFTIDLPAAHSERPVPS